MEADCSVTVEGLAAFSCHITCCNGGRVSLMELRSSLGSRGAASGGGSSKRSNKPHNLLFFKTRCICSIHDMVSADSTNQYSTIQRFSAIFLIFWPAHSVGFRRRVQATYEFEPSEWRFVSAFCIVVFFRMLGIK